MAARAMAILKVPSENPKEMELVKDDHAVQALAPQRTDQALHVRILPRGLAALTTSSMPRMPITRRKRVLRDDRS